MSQTLLIFYDLTDPGQNREALIKKIKLYGKWARVGNAAYLIHTDEIPTSVRDNLSKVLKANDRIFVGAAPPPSAWQGLPEEVSKWILANQQ